MFLFSSAKAVCLTHLTIVCLLLAGGSLQGSDGGARKIAVAQRSVPRTTASQAIKSPRQTNATAVRSRSSRRNVQAASYQQAARDGGEQVPADALPQPAAPQSVLDVDSPMVGGPMMLGGDEEYGCASCGSMDDCSCLISRPLVDWSRAEIFAGVTSFATAGNFLTTGANAAGQVEGSAGLQEGFNLGTCSPLSCFGRLSAQVGLRAIQANLDGSASTIDSRNQLFATAGFFRRVDYGLQGGLVVDYLHDDWNYTADLLQLRGELSFMLSPCHDAGVRITSSQRTSDIEARIAGIAAPVTLKLAGLDTYRFFYRFRFGGDSAGSAELNAGFSENRDAILGIGLSTPLHGSVGLQVGSTVLIPSSDHIPKYAYENWNIGAALVWTPGRGFGMGRDYHRPLFDVADNGNFLTQRVK